VTAKLAAAPSQDVAVQREKTLPQLLAERAQATPDRLFLQDADGPSLTYGQTYELALRWAGALRAAGVRPGDRVATLLDNCLESPVMWLALSILGALEVSISTAYRGTLLTHALTVSEARVLFADSTVLEALGMIISDVPALETVIVRGTGDGTLPKLPVAVHREEDLLDPGQPIVPGPPPSGHDIACVVFTSGTTGPSKGALVPWAAVAAGTMTLTGALTGDDVIYHMAAANHLIARVHVLATAQLGGGIVLKRAFRTQEFWSDIDRFGCTYTTLVGAMAHFIMSQPETEGDADHPLAKVNISPVHPRLEELRRRFGIQDVLTAYGSTEVPSPINTGWKGIDAIGSCGRVASGWPGWVLRIVDEHDEEVAPGEVGELMVRTEAPWTIAVGYLGMPQESATAWRNGWFHTGDAFRQDTEGRFYFVDRIKDAIRRRGENISSFEVEMEVNTHPDVAESAAVAVPAEGAEDEIKVFVVPVAGRSVDPEDLVRYLIPRMARYMVPRYVELIEELPKTPTLRVKKVELRQRTPGEVWDRVAAGVEIPKKTA